MTGAGSSVRPGVTQVFDLDGVRLAALAAAAGLPVAVPESPEAPPVGLRPARVAREAARRRPAVRAQPRERPGAGGARSSPPPATPAPTLPFIAGVAVYTDERSARVLQRFPGLHLDGAAVERVLAAPDPREAGIAAAVDGGAGAAGRARRGGGEPVRDGLGPG